MRTAERLRAFMTTDAGRQTTVTVDILKLEKLWKQKEERWTIRY